MAQKEYKSKKQLGEEGDSLILVLVIEICPYEQMVYTQTRISPVESHEKNPFGFWDTNRQFFLKKSTCWKVDFAVPAVHKLK